MKKRKEKGYLSKTKALLIVLFIPVAVTVFTLTAIIWVSISNPDFFENRQIRLWRFDSQNDNSRQNTSQSI